jgi:hypothetical protein
MPGKGGIGASYYGGPCPGGGSSKKETRFELQGKAQEILTSNLIYHEHDWEPRIKRVMRRI